MKRFLKETIGFSIIVFAFMYMFFCQADGSTDAFYLKFASSQQTSLVVGSSRAAQGILPSEIFQVIPNKRLYNYGFTIFHSPFGEIYLNSIKKKIEKNTRDGLFIVCVNPWTLSSMGTNPNDPILFREQNSFLDITSMVHSNPNIEYLIESYRSRYIDILTNKSRKGDYQTFYVHDDGWLEVMIESDMISRTDRTKNKIAAYRKKLTGYSGFSKTRMQYLKKTIALLQTYGDVYMVRLPIHDSMLKLEEQLIPDFDTKMESLSVACKIRYINAIPLRANYQYTDGNHLDIQSAKAFSSYLAETIKKLQQNSSKF